MTAAEAFADLFISDPCLADDLGPHLTCAEAGVFASLLTELGAGEPAGRLLASHRDSDDELDPCHARVEPAAS